MSTFNYDNRPASSNWAHPSNWPYRETSDEDNLFPSPNAYDALNRELYQNERRHIFHPSTTTLADSVHTEFQEDVGHEDTKTLVARDEMVDAYPNRKPTDWETETRLLHDGVDEYDPPPRLRNSYMGRTSPFSMEYPELQQDERWLSEGKATLSFPAEEGEGEIMSIQRLNLAIFEERCPLLAAAFESSQSGPRLYLETLSSETAIPFLRFLHTGNYDMLSDYGEDVPTSVLLHCRMYRLATIYDLNELKSQAYVNVLRQCEFGCSSPNKPIDLCTAIRFCYKHLSDQGNLIDAIVHYCVECFLSHRLADDATFKQLAFELRPFHQALCRNVMNRDFQDEAAMAIIRMPFESHIPATFASREDFARIGDVVFHFHANDDFETPSSALSKRKRTDPNTEDKKLRDAWKAYKPDLPSSAGSQSTGPTTSNLTLALRGPPQRHVAKHTLPDDSTSSESEEDGFRFVRRRTSSEHSATSSPAPASLSDGESFHMVQAPAQVEALSSSEDDSDADTVVEMESTATASALALPVRQRRRGMYPTAATTADPFVDVSSSASDSEWDII